MSLKALFTISTINKLFDEFQESTDRKIVELLAYAGNFAAKTARENGNYRDRTGNLRNSIGYVVVKDGHIEAEEFKGPADSDGPGEGKALAYSVAKSHNKGYVLIVVAGMRYALYVEALKNYDVLEGSVHATEQLVKQLAKKLLNERD